ncbi:MAG TPA: helix-turn-helix transcriptional regulator [Burkholderiales bacterium]|nr:helix-turn-helix transcriptional regulator [Burkholderiales bacterium]
MKREKAKPIRIERGSRNVYADLGYADAEDMLVKAQLVTEIADLIRARNLTQEQAAQILGLTQPKISAMLNGQFRGISERKLLTCLTRLGRDIQIVIKAAPRQRATGRLTVLFA